jgi:hypothetical protein
MRHIESTSSTEDSKFLYFKDKTILSEKGEMKRLLSLALTIALFALYTNCVYAACPNGELLISPHGSYYPLPIMLSSPATFTIASINSTVAVFPNIVLVMTKTSYDSLTGSVTVNWTGTSGQYNQSIFQKTDFQAVSSGYVPDAMLTPFDSGRYNVSMLKEHLSVNGTKDDTLYYTFGPFLGGSGIGKAPRAFTVTLPSTHPRMLVLAVARSGVCTPFFNMRVQPCKPGFIVPEPAPIFLATASLAAAALFIVKRRKQ